MSSLAIVGIGTAVPPHAIGQSDAAEIVQGYTCTTETEAQYYRDDYHAVGVDTRHCVILDHPDGDLATRQSFYPDRLPDDRGSDATLRG